MYEEYFEDDIKELLIRLENVGGYRGEDEREMLTTCRKEGERLKGETLTPIYLYNSDKHIFSVTTEEYLENKFH